MAAPLQLSRSRTYPVPQEEAFERTIVLPLEELFDRRYGPIPPISGTVQDGPWSTAGQVRTIRTSDGGTMREHLLAVDAPTSFSYELTDITGPMKPIAERVEGRWAFETVGTGCRITWSWTIHPKSALGGLILPVFGRLWQGYAGRALDRLEERLLEG